MSSRSFVVSIHDVSPFTREAVTRIIADLAKLGVRQLSLLVIPDHHHRGNIKADPSFAPWLREQVAAGCESVLHGYFHQRERQTRESPQTRFFTRLYTAGEGEFFDIPYDTARTFLERGREELTEVAGVAPAGFIAPAWLLSAEAESAARDLGFTYTTRLKSFCDLPARRVHRAQSLCWSARSAWRRAVSREWNPFLFNLLKQNPLLRISIHPPDIAYPAMWLQVKELISRGLEDRTPIAYRDFHCPART